MRKTGVNQNCEYCKTGFYVSGWRQGVARYCSRKCQYATKERGKRISKSKSKKIEVTCIACEKKFLVSPSRKRVSCSRACLYASSYWKDKFSKIHKGKKAPYAKPPVMRGADNPNWKGGITPINTAIRNSKEYADWRKAVFERDDYTCQMCGDRGGEIHADHIKPFAYYPELRLDLSNGRTLCVPCHKETPTYLSRCRA